MKDTLQALMQGRLVMMPQNFYAEAYKIGPDEHGDDCIVTHPGNEKLEDYEMLAMLMDSDILKWEIDESEFPDKTVEAYCEYYGDDEDDAYDGPQKTDCVCKRCGNETVVKEDASDYPYYCYSCDQNMYSFEVEGGEPKSVCAEYIEDASDMDTRFYEVSCPDGSNTNLEIEVALLTNETELAWLEVTAHADGKKVFNSSQCIGEWHDKLGLTHTISEEYITVQVANCDKRATLQVKVQKDEPGIIFDLFKYESTPTTDAFSEREEEIVEALGYLTMEDCHEDT